MAEERDGHVSKTFHLVNFALRGEEFGLDIGSVREITTVPEISHIPNAPFCIRGVANLRGRVIAVVDLAKRFGLAPGEDPSEDARIIVTEIRGQMVGILVDEVTGVVRVPEASVEPPPDLFESAIRKDYITGVVKLDDRLVILLDPERILAPDEQQMAAAATGS